MRHAKRTDENQKALVTELRALNFFVRVTSNVGNGFPDILVAKDRIAFGVEVKVKGKRKHLTDAEIEMRVWWEQLGMKYVVAETAGEVVDAWKELKLTKKDK